MTDSRHADAPFKISVVSADDYDRLIAEVVFPNGVALIVSEERGIGQFDISVHSPRAKSRADFDNSKNIGDLKLRLKDFTNALDEAARRLALLGPERT